ncbi:hypothetical protein GCM10009624_21590 [Gordonia sinesedis]
MSDELDRRRRRSASGQQPSGGMHEAGPGHTGPWLSPRRGDASDAPGIPPSGTSHGDALDFAEVQFDDAFLEALSHDRPTPTRDDTEYQLAALLSGWRQDVVATPAPDGPSVDDVEHAIAAAQPTRRASGVVRSLRIAAGAAAVAIVAAAGLTVMSKGAQPGDPLWGVKKVAFSQEASETQAAYDVRASLEGAEAAIAAGDTAKAASLIARAQSKMGPVDGDTRSQMTEWIARLRAGTTDTTTPSNTTAPTREQTNLPGPTHTDPRTVTTAPRPTDPTDARTTKPTDPSTPTTTTPPPTTTPQPTGGPTGGATTTKGATPTTTPTR